MDRFAVKNLFGIKGFNIAWYGIIIAVGFLAGLKISSCIANKKDINDELLYEFALLAIPFSLICARLYYVAFRFDYYIQNPVKLFAVREGGMAIYGGIMGGIFSAVIYCRLKKINLWEFTDILTPGLAIAQSIGRWGNFVNQEAFGKAVLTPILQFFPYAVYIENTGQWHQATFFYESTGTLVIFFILIYLSYKNTKAGTVTAFYMLLYGIIRFFIEGLRTDSLYLLLGIRVSQLVSVLIVVFAISFLKQVRQKSSGNTFD